MKFKDRERILRALDHYLLLTTAEAAKIAREHSKYELYGDRLLYFLLASRVIRDFWPDANVGQVASVVDRLVSNATLAQAARMLELETFMRFPGASTFDNVYGSDKAMGDTVERIIYIAYEEEGIQGTLNCIHAFLEPFLNKLEDRPQSAWFYQKFFG